MEVSKEETIELSSDEEVIIINSDSEEETNQTSEEKNIEAEAFTSGDVREWYQWRSKFEAICRIANWNNQRRRYELQAAMKGTAKHLTCTVPAEANIQAQPVELLLEAYQQRFIAETARRSALNHSGLAEAWQEDMESILNWSNRLYRIYSQVCSDLGQVNIDLIPDMRNRFVLGLKDARIRISTWTSEPATHSEALAYALDFEQIAKIHTPLPIITSVTSLSPAGTTNFNSATVPESTNTEKIWRGGRCTICREEGHRKQTCPWELASTPTTSKQVMVATTRANSASAPTIDEIPYTQTTASTSNTSSNNIDANNEVEVNTTNTNLGNIEKAVSKFLQEERSKTRPILLNIRKDHN